MNNRHVYFLTVPRAHSRIHRIAKPTSRDACLFTTSGSVVFLALSHSQIKESKMSRSPIPVFWYENPAHYEEFQKILSDAYVLPFDYHDWRIRTDSMVERYENSGIQAVKVVASTYDFITWCQAHGRDISTKSCNDYAVSESGLQILRDREFDWGD
ncbi:hypothetical protein Q6295_42465, partial [Klebsiella pneumoniae]